VVPVRIHARGAGQQRLKDKTMPYRIAMLVACALALGTPVRAQSAASAAAREEGFTAENDAAMRSMMAGMHIRPSGDADRDFATMMIAHHQGAIDMAKAELRYGTNEQLRRIAQEIVVDQIAEIAAMHVAVGDRPLPPRAAPTAMATPAQTMPHAGAMQPNVRTK